MSMRSDKGIASVSVSLQLAWETTGECDYKPRGRSLFNSRRNCQTTFRSGRTLSGPTGHEGHLLLRTSFGAGLPQTFFGKVCSGFYSFFHWVVFLSLSLKGS